MNRDEHLVYKLKNALYGLKQGPRAWYSKINHHFRVQGFSKSESEHTLYKKVSKDDDILIISLYVDDIVYTSFSVTLIEKFKDDMMRTFNMFDHGVMS